MVKWLVLLGWLLLPSIVLAQWQDRRFLQFSPDRLPSPFVVNFLEDADRHLWVATRGGLCRFDGKNFKVFQHQPKIAKSLSNSYVRHLLEDKQGRLWLATFGSGLSIFNKYNETFENIRNPHSPESNRIHGFVQDGQGRFWMATEGAGLHCFYPGNRRFEQIAPKQEVIKKKIHPTLRSLVQGKNKVLWVGTTGRGFFSYDIENQRFDTSFCQLAKGLEVMDFVEDGADTLYAATSDGLLKISIKQRKVLAWFRSDKSTKGPIANRIFMMKMSPDRDLWMATVSGLSIFNLKKQVFENQTESPFDPYGLKEKRLISVYLDRKGLAWLGSWNQGFYSTPVSGLGFRCLRDKPTNQAGGQWSEIMDLNSAGSGNLWVTTQSNGIIQLDYQHETACYFSPAQLLDSGLIDKELLSCYQDRNGVVWLGKAIQTSVTNPKEKVGKAPFKPFVGPDGVPLKMQVNNFKEDDQGRIWMATFQGLYCYDPHRRKTYLFRFRDSRGKVNKKAANQLFSLWITQNQSIFVTTNGAGLVQFFPKTRQFRVFAPDSSNPYSLRTGVLSCVKEDASGRLWIGSENYGLFVTHSQHPGRFVNFSEESGIKDGRVESIEFDATGHLWIAGKNLIRVLPKGNQNGLPNRIETVSYEAPEFVLPNMFKTDASFRQPDGRLFFGGSAGLVYFDPASIKQGLPLAFPAINGLKILEKEWVGDSAITFKKSLVLPYDQNFIRIQYANLGMAGLASSHCRYRLEGLQSDWIIDRPHGEAVYTDLKPGVYNFVLQAGNLEGRWNPNGRRLTIEILAPWWQTWWFYSLVFILFSGGGSFGLFLRIQRIRRQAEARSKAEVEKLEMELKVLRAQINPHFMFNALNSIEDFIWKKEVHLAADYLARFAHLMRLILENSYFSTVPLSKELEAVSIYLQLEAMRSELAFDFTIIDNTGLDPEETYIAPMLLQPFVENAVLHGLMPLKERRGFVELRLEKADPGHIRIEITDNGVGRKAKGPAERVSFGMKLTSDRILKLNLNQENALMVKDLKDEAGNAKGTLVIIRLPFESPSEPRD